MAKKKIIRTIRETAKLMLNNWEGLLLIIIFDVLFILLLAKMRAIQIYTDSLIYPLFIGKARLIYSILYVIFEFLLIIGVYSFFKYLIIKFIQGFKEQDFELKFFFHFVKINLVIFAPIIIIIVTILNLILTYLNRVISRGGIDPFIFTLTILAITALLLILFIFIYNFVNITHFTFFKERHIWETIKKSIANSSKIKCYRIYWNDFKIILILIVPLLVIYFLLRKFMIGDFSSYMRYYGTYKISIYSIIILAFYLVLLFNRFYFYLITGNKD